MIAYHTQHGYFDRCIECQNYFQYSTDNLEIPRKCSYHIGICPWCNTPLMFISTPFPLTGMMSYLQRRFVPFCTTIAKEHYDFFVKLKYIDVDVYDKACNGHLDKDFIEWKEQEHVRERINS